MKPAYRTVAVKKRHYQDQELPKFWRPKLDDDQQVRAQVIHWDLVTRFTDGSADSEDLWDWMETGMTYHKMMKLLIEDGMVFTPEAQDALASQLAIYEDVIARYKRTRRVAFSGPEYLIAKAAACVMDSLIALDRHGVAKLAGIWAIEQMLSLRRQFLADPQFSPATPTHHNPKDQPHVA